VANPVAGEVYELDPLTSAVVDAEQDMSARNWNQPPQLYALADPAGLAERGFGSEVSEAPPGSLIPVEQEPLPEGELDEALSTITWPETVLGCVLVTELQVQIVQEKESGVSADMPVQRARLAVGVLRDGRYASCLRLKGSEELLIETDLADDLVTLLLGTF